MIDESIETKFKRMQSVIENGRLIRDRINKPLKTPLREMVIVDASQEMLDDCLSLETYIKDELNVMELRTETQEDKFIKYNCEPDNKLIGGALKKAYNKDFKKKILELDSDSLKGYLEGNKLEVNGVEIL